MEERLEIEAHARAGKEIPYSRTDDDGLTIDLSASALFFECHDAGLRVALAQHPDIATDRVIKLTREQVALLPMAWVPCVVVDETGLGSGSTPMDDVRGIIRRVGHSEEPA